MVSNIKTGLVIFLTFVIFNIKGQDKEFSKSSLKYGIGIGVSDGHRATGGGVILLVGYQHNIWKDKLRLNPNLTFGSYHAKYVQDVRDQWFNSTNLEAILYYDLVRVKAFAFTIGTGVVVNNMKGLLGTGGYPPAENRSEYFSDWHYGGYLGGGFRIAPQNGRLAFEIMPLNFHVGPDYFMEGYAKIGLDVKLK